MGSCAAPSAKGDDKFITTDYLQQCPPQRKLISLRRCRIAEVRFAEHVVTDFNSSLACGNASSAFALGGGEDRNGGASVPILD
jgi:hypothetical protein